MPARWVRVPAPAFAGILRPGVLIPSPGTEGHANVVGKGIVGVENAGKCAPLESSWIVSLLWGAADEGESLGGHVCEGQG